MSKELEGRMISVKGERELYDALSILNKEGRIGKSREYIQHGDVSVLRHCMAVARMSMKIADKLPVEVKREELIRGALLHDYFLYDWHVPEKSHKLHGFTHPKKALKNAKRDYKINKTEEDIIAKHMFPLTPIPPKTREGWIVCLADKIVATRETMEGFSKGRKA